MNGHGEVTRFDTSRRLLTILTILLLGVCLTIQPAAATSHLDAASEHTTDTDFNNGTYSNLQLSGTGDAAQLELRPDTYSSDVSTSAHEDVSGSTERRGITVETNDYPVKNLVAELDANALADTAYLQDSNGNILETVSIDANGNASFTTTLDPHTTYGMTVNNSDGTQYDRSQDTSGNYPYTSTALNISEGADSTGPNGFRPENLRNVSYDYDNTSPGTYTGVGHDAEGIERGFVNLTLDNAQADVEWQAHDGSQWVTVATDTFTSSGRKTTALSGSYEKWRLDTTLSSDGAGTADLKSEGVEFESSTPTIDASSASPDDERITTKTTELEINISDADFPLTQSDELTVYWYHNDKLDAKTTRTENGTANHTLSDLTVGENTWHVTVADSYGNTATTGNDSFSFTAPENMTIYNETAPETVIDDREITVEFFDLDGDEIYTATTTNGEVELDQLTDSEFAVRISAPDYADRQVIIKDIWSQQDVWLLNESHSDISTVSPTFVIEDETGSYDPTTSRVFIQRGLNISNTTTYHTIAAEEVGTDGYTETIEAKQRYRIIVESPAGDRRVLGKFSAADSNTYTLTVEELVFDLSKDGEAIDWGFNHTSVENGQDKVNFRYQDLEDQTENLEVVIYERGNASNELHNATYSGPLGNLSITEPVPSGKENAEWVVEWNAERGDDELDARWMDGPLNDLGLPTSDRLLHTLAVGFILIVGGLASQVNAPAVGFTVAGTAGIAYYIGFLPSAVAGGMIALAFFVPVLYLVQSEGRFG